MLLTIKRLHSSFGFQNLGTMLLAPGALGGFSRETFEIILPTASRALRRGSVQAALSPESVHRAEWKSVERHLESRFFNLGAFRPSVNHIGLNTLI